METTKELERIYGPIRDDLEMVEEKLYDLIPEHLDPISTVERYIFDNGGKRLRPALVLLSARAVHHSNTSDAGGVRDLPSDMKKSEGNSVGTLLLDRAVAFAVAAELIHTATLVHDDLLDGSVLRRGHRTINSRWGNEVALLLGDHLYLKATEILTNERILNPDKNDDFKRVYRASHIMLRTAAKIFRGEVLQHRKRGKLSTTEEDYFAIIESKSASFISSCCMIGAMLDGNACPGAEAALARYGLNLGIAFQIRDDILDIMGDERTIGKAVGSDLSEGRLTLPLIHLLANARDGDREYLESVLSSSVSAKRPMLSRWRKNSHESDYGALGKKDLLRIRKLLSDYGSIVYSTDVASRFVEAAKSEIKEIPDSQAKQSLIYLADHVMRREN